ncbi:MAG: hypothetical protein LC112_04225 [Flavobacteriales bacterium]|nr:hypothetical protein [Flavobacteriales bacterium]
MKHYLFATLIFTALAGMFVQCQKAVAAEENQQSEITKTAGKSESTIGTNSPSDLSILIPTSYRKTSKGYPKNVENKNWFELYKEEKTGKWLIGKADLQISYDRDECSGDDVMILKSKNENAVLFFTNFKGLNENPETILENKPLFPEHNISFKFKGTEYKLVPVGNVLDDQQHIIPTSMVRQKTNQELADSQITNYLLSFSFDDQSYNLATIDKIEFSTPKIIWIGDLNGDDLPDMILDLSDSYEAQHLFFYLSDSTDKEKPLKKVGDILVVSDC